MKRNGLLWVLASALMLCLTYTSCEEQEGLIDDKKDEKATGEEAFFPKAFADKEVAAWYSWTEKDKDKTKTEAVFLFKDNTFVVTKNKVHTDGRYERAIEATGTYELTEGDYKNGKARAIVMADNGEAAGVMNVVIEDGHLTTDQGEEVFVIQDNAKVPKASDPDSGNINQGGDNNNNNQGGDQGDGFGAFFPKAYAGKSISAWYSYAGSESEQGFEMKYVAAIYFFGDGTYVATSNVAVSGPTGDSFERTIGAEGGYRIIEGDFNTGKISITYDGDKSMTVEIENGQLKAIDLEDESVTIYFKQDPGKTPEPSDPTENGNQNGNQGGDNGDDNGNEGQSDASLVAWYTSTQTYNNREYTIAIVLLDDGTVAFTSTPAADGSGAMVMTSIMGVGTYKIVEGDLTNGTIRIVMYGEPQDFTASNGVVTVKEDGQEMTYYQQDNAKYNGPTDFSDYNSDDNGDDDGDDTGDDTGDDDGGDDSGSDANLAAWYKATRTIDNVEYDVAAILFDDNTIIFTRTRVPDGSGFTYQTEIIGKGKYAILDGDLINGRIKISMFEQESYLSIIDGVISSEDVEYIKQDNSKYTGSTDFSDVGGDDVGGDDGGDDDGEEYNTDDIKAYLPSEYAKMTVSAWYIAINEEDNKVKVEAVFLFNDNSLVVTKSKIYAKSDGRDPQYDINATGTYQLTSGNFTTGRANVVTADGMVMEVAIENGILTAMGTDFEKMPNEGIAKMTTNGSTK